MLYLQIWYESLIYAIGLTSTLAIARAMLGLIPLALTAFVLPWLLVVLPINITVR